jgi:serine/threonine protein kinase
VLGSATGAGTARDRLLREARNAAALNHPNICTVYEVGEVGDRAFIAMEYVDGESLSDRLLRGPFLLEGFLRYGIDAADAVAYAHEHRWPWNGSRSRLMHVTRTSTGQYEARSRSTASATILDFRS